MGKTKKYELYIGLKDQETYEELFSADDFRIMLSKICSTHEIGFSLTNQVGGYNHNKGFVTETSLRITLFGISEEEVKVLGEKLKEIVNTDTIMITCEDCDYYYC